jgi:peptidoglycan/xylan/chitin deacetylase (PgdA/CDA1 family)
MSNAFLQMLEEHGQRPRFLRSAGLPNVTRVCARIVDAGHELASHGYGHERASDLTETAFSSRYRFGQETARRHLGLAGDGLPRAKFFDWRSESVGL